MGAEAEVVLPVLEVQYFSKGTNLCEAIEDVAPDLSSPQGVSLFSLWVFKFCFCILFSVILNVWIESGVFLFFFWVNKSPGLFLSVEFIALGLHSFLCFVFLGADEI